MEAEHREKTDSVLLVSGSEQATAALKAALPAARFAPVDAVESAEAARTWLERQDCALVIVNAPLVDASGTAFARAMSRDACHGVLLLMPADEYESACAALSGTGVLTLKKPANPSLLRQALELLLAMRERLCAMEQKTHTLELKMADIRIVNRAKWVLIEQLKMDEAAAHRYIEKQAMNQQRTRREIAESILTTYEMY